MSLDLVEATADAKHKLADAQARIQPSVNVICDALRNLGISHHVHRNDSSGNGEIHAEVYIKLFDDDDHNIGVRSKSGGEDITIVYGTFLKNIKTWNGYSLNASFSLDDANSLDDAKSHKIIDKAIKLAIQNALIFGIKLRTDKFTVTTPAPPLLPTRTTRAIVSVQAKPEQSPGLTKPEDIQNLVAQAIASGRSSEAILVGVDIQARASRLFESAQEVGEHGLMTRGAAALKLRARSQELVSAQTTFQDASQNIARLEAPTGVLAPLLELVQKLPMFDPKAGLLKQLKAVRGEIQGALLSSAEVMRTHEDIQEKLAQSHEQTLMLIKALEEGIAQLNTDLDGELSIPQREAKKGVHEMLTAVLENAQYTVLAILHNTDATNVTLSTERQFAKSIMQMQSAWTLIMTQMNVTLQQMRTALEPHMKEQAETALALQFKQITGQLEDLRETIIGRAHLISANPSPTAALAQMTSN